MAKHHLLEVASAEVPSSRQRLFLRYFTAILIDLVVLNLFAEYWWRVEIDSFTVSLVAAVLLQALLKLTLVLEHRVAAWFSARSGVTARVGRFLSAWAILFGSKFAMLWAVDLVVGRSLRFEGPHHGVLAFIVVVVVMLVAEELFVRGYRRLG